ncbi:MAG: 5-dehydro-4-deoxy-D-glucuronate isomerase [Deltaproteobacteria bacterium]|nr:5-dehydro-4-deoxy-D-glucuronate isomerase [Deltaproteobacteria bacterium]
MEIRHPSHPEHVKHMDTQSLREEFLIEELFQAGQLNLTYSYFDRIIVGGSVPTDKALALEGGKTLGAASFFERREGGVINIGSPGTVTVDGEGFHLGTRDGLYIGMGATDVSFASDQKTDPAKFYMLSGPAHKSYPHQRVTQANAKRVHLGSLAESNERTIYQYLHPDVLESCQLCMGMTLLEPNCVWNTMPTHTHERRMEVYLYFDMDPDTVVMHLMGQPDETRHLVVRNEEAVISPSWSIHSGVGTKNYTFIWGMVGENQTFTDMDGVPMQALK